MGRFETRKTKIELTDSGFSVVMKMSEGNPGALSVCIQILRDGAEIDPDDFAGGLGNLLSLDTLGCYGSRIWMLYKDVCGEDLRVMCAILRSWQLGYTTEASLRYAIDHYGEGLDVPALVAKVEEHLPRFKRGGTDAQQG